MNKYKAWMNAKPYKRNQGRRVRQMTLAASLVLVGLGCWSLRSTLSVFYGDEMVQFGIPAVLLALGLWLSWRLVHVPTFADFLIATEAEVNKVSWPTRNQLVQATGVVLVFMVFVTLFLFVSDALWQYALTAIGVLPGSG